MHAEMLEVDGNTWYTARDGHQSIEPVVSVYQFDRRVNTQKIR